MAKRRQVREVRESNLHQWRLVEDFARVLDEANARTAALVRRSAEDPRRELTANRYLALFFFGLLNPVVETMRGLCAASALGRVQREVCGRRVSLGSFSEMQTLIEPALLEEVLNTLAGQVLLKDAGAATRKWPHQALRVMDSTLWRALPRMAWARWRTQGIRQSAARLHLVFHLVDQKPLRASLTSGDRCERAVWAQEAQAGECYIGDRYYGGDYQLLGQLKERGVDFVVRVRGNVDYVCLEELELNAADGNADVVSDQWVRLAHERTGARLRLVTIAGEQEPIILASTLPPEQWPAELVAAVYRQRWQVELFFRWIKCLIGQRHFLAESQRGVTVQMYLTLIAALLLQRAQGGRVNKRQWELLQFYLLGYATLEEVTAQLPICTAATDK
jgi:DDE family transposase